MQSTDESGPHYDSESNTIVISKLSELMKLKNTLLQDGISILLDRFVDILEQIYVGQTKLNDEVATYIFIPSI